MTKKTLNNTTVNKAKKQVNDLEIFGNGDLFELLSKASSKKEGWMKSTKACEIPGLGCIVQVTTQQGDRIAEAVTWVPNAKILRSEIDGVVYRQLASITSQDKEVADHPELNDGDFVPVYTEKK